MSQHDFIIANQTASSARADINSALQALASNNSGASAPSTTYANMWWYDTGANILKQRNESNTAWVNVAYINQSTNKFEILDDTKVVTTSGSQVGILGDQTTATWEAGTGTTESLVSPAKVKAAVNAMPSQTLSISSGHTYLPNGVLMNFGQVAIGSDTSASISWNKAFPAAVISAQVTFNTPASNQSDGAVGIYNLTTSGATVQNGSNNAETLGWLAIGY